MQIVDSPVSTGEVEAPGGQEWPVKWWRSLAALGTDRRLGTSVGLVASLPLLKL